MASIYPFAYILYIYIPYLAAASLNVSFRLKENRHHEQTHIYTHTHMYTSAHTQKNTRSTPTRKYTHDR